MLACHWGFSFSDIQDIFGHPHVVEEKQRPHAAPAFRESSPSGRSLSFHCEKTSVLLSEGVVHLRGKKCLNPLRHAKGQEKPWYSPAWLGDISLRGSMIDVMTRYESPETLGCNIDALLIQHVEPWQSIVLTRLGKQYEINRKIVYEIKFVEWTCLRDNSLPFASLSQSCPAPATPQVPKSPATEKVSAAQRARPERGDCVRRYLRPQLGKSVALAPFW